MWFSMVVVCGLCLWLHLFQSSVCFVWVLAFVAGFVCDFVVGWFLVFCCCVGVVVCQGWFVVCQDLFVVYQRWVVDGVPASFG